MSSIESPKVIISHKGIEVTENVTSFVYEYDQDADDTCEITISTDNRMLADNPAFQEKAILEVTWGYIGGKTKTRKVEVADVSATYSETEKLIHIKATDLAKKLKDTPSDKVHEKVTVLDIAKEIVNKHGLRLDASLTVKQDGKAIYHGTDEKGRYLHVFDTYGQASSSVMTQDGNYTAARESTAVPKEVEFNFYTALPQANKSDYKVLKDLLDREKGGPYEVTGRDDKLIVRDLKSAISKRPSRTYHYEEEPFDIISFEPETKTKTKSANTAAETVAYDEMTQQTGKTYASTETNDMPKMASTVNNGTWIQTPVPTTDASERQGRVSAQKALRDRVDLSKNSIVDHLVKTGDYKEVTIGNDQLQVSLVDTHSTSKQTPDGNYTAATYHTSLIAKSGIIVPIAHSSNSPDTDPTKSANQQAEQEMNTNPGGLVVPGDPSIEAGIVVRVIGVAKKYAGNYYVKKAKHSVVPGSPYLLTMQISRNANNNSKEAVGITPAVNTTGNVLPPVQDAPVQKSLPIFNASTPSMNVDTNSGLRNLLSR